MPSWLKWIQHFKVKHFEISHVTGYDNQNYPWVVYALNQGAIILKAPADGQWGHIPIEGEVGRGPKLKSLSLFLQTVRKTLLLHSQVQANPFKNAQLDGLRYAEHLYRYGPTLTPAA